MADKIFTYTIIIIMVSLLFAVIGAQTAVGAAFNVFGITSPSNDTQGAADLYGSTVYTWILALVGLAAVAYIGFIPRASVESGMLLTVGYVVGIAAIIMDFLAIVSYGWTQGVFAGWIGTLICFPLYAGYLLTVLQSWRGTD